MALWLPAQNVMLLDSPQGTFQASASIPPNVQVGDYEVSILVDSLPYKGRIRVRPAGTEEIHLSEFDPNRHRLPVVTLPTTVRFS
jgi:hypothetical protein